MMGTVYLLTSNEFMGVMINKMINRERTKAVQREKSSGTFVEP
jgi:hypothetical protein